MPRRIFIPHDQTSLGNVAERFENAARLIRDVMEKMAQKDVQTVQIPNWKDVSKGVSAVESFSNDALLGFYEAMEERGDFEADETEIQSRADEAGKAAQKELKATQKPKRKKTKKKRA